MTKSDEGKKVLKQVWQQILETMDSQSQIPFSTGVLTAAAAISFSFGLDEKTNSADEHRLTHNFVGYLKIVLDEAYGYVPLGMSEESKHADGYAFGKPVWDSEYPESSFFIAEGLDGVLYIYNQIRSTYPSILQPNSDHFLIMGYSYVCGVVHREQL